MAHEMERIETSGYESSWDKGDIIPAEKIILRWPNAYNLLLNIHNKGPKIDTKLKLNNIYGIRRKKYMRN